MVARPRGATRADLSASPLRFRSRCGPWPSDPRRGSCSAGSRRCRAPGYRTGSQSRRRRRCRPRSIYSQPNAHARLRPMMTNTDTAASATTWTTAARMWLCRGEPYRLPRDRAPRSRTGVRRRRAARWRRRRAARDFVDALEIRAMTNEREVLHDRRDRASSRRYPLERHERSPARRAARPGAHSAIDGRTTLHTGYVASQQIASGLRRRSAGLRRSVGCVGRCCAAPIVSVSPSSPPPTRLPKLLAG